MLIIINQTMKQLITILFLIIANNVTKAQNAATDYDVIIAEKIETIQQDVVSKSNVTNTEKSVITIVKPSNVVYTKVVNNLPNDVLEYVKKFSERKNYITGIYKLGKTHFPKINKTFAKYNVPSEVNVLIALESYFNKNVISKAKAVGYWQFIDATAIEYGLNISDSLKDERRDFDKSTKAAAKYLNAHYKQIGDWYLTVASYNCGIGNVRKAIKKTGKTKPTFYETKPFLPKETQNYVMNYIALNVILKNYANFLQNKIQWQPVTQKVLVDPNSTKQYTEKLTK
jgi:membrane-bound lytic murein transglycosylase D